MPNKKLRRKYTKRAIIAGNILLLLIVSIFILANRSASQTVRASSLNSAISTAQSAPVNPLDQISASQIALTAAQGASLPELNAVRNQADSDALTLSVVPNDSTAVAKPQIVATAQKSKQDIKEYVTKPGDTVSSLATKYGVSANSIRWSNNLSGDNIQSGIKISIPPVNGIVYTVKAGDTPASLASHFQSDVNQIISYNDAEIAGLKPGDRIIIPNGQVAAPTSYSSRYTPALSVSFVANYGSNGYDFGYCTWYAASKVSVPNNWGNANTWDDYARISGWTVSTRPVVGAVAQTDAMSYLGHVAYVEAVSADGTQMKYSDMNGLAGWGRVGYSDWVSSTTFQHYIYH